MSYASLDGSYGLLPLSEASEADHHVLSVRWIARDPLRYRVDTTTVEPTLEAGTVTYLQNGTTTTIFDRRANVAYSGTVPAGDAAFMLSELRSGTVLPEAPPTTESIARFLQQTRRAGAALHPPAYATLLGQVTVAGRRANLIVYGPIVRSDVITGCSFQHAGHCLHHPRGYGEYRVAVDTRYPLILAYDMTGLSLRQSAVADIHYAVTALRFGARLGAGELTPEGQVPIRHVRYPFGEESPSYFSAPIPAPFAAPVAPSGLRTLFSDGTAVLGGRVTHVETLFGAGRSVFVSRDLPSVFQGRYLYVRQQLQVGGLPAGLRAGSPVRAGACTIFFRAAGHGRRLAAFQRRSVSILISTNSLDRPHLLGYAARLCTTVGR